MPVDRTRACPAGGLRIVDLGAGMAAALVSTLFADGGALVHRIAPPGDEVFDAVYPAHAGWRAATTPADPADLDHLLGQADLCIIGGEDHPEVRTRRDAKELHERHPHLVVVDLPAYVPGFAPGAPAVDLLVQARTGMVFEHYSDRPLCFAVPFPTYGQTLLATMGAWAALLVCQRGEPGQIVTASLQQGVALYMMPFWMRAERPDAEFDKVTPKDVEHLIFRCADGTYVQFVMGVPAAVARLYRILGIDEPVDPADRGIPKTGSPPDRYFGDRPLIGRHVATMKRADILAAAARVGLPAGPVLQLGECWDDPQIAENGLLVTRGSALGVGRPVGITPGVVAPRRTTPEPRHPEPRHPEPRHPEPQRPASGRSESQPLEGVSILDFGSYVAGPLASRLLIDLGASVVKVEPLSGDPNRGLQRHFLASQSGKRNIAVNVKSDEGREVLRRLVASCDVVAHNFRPAVSERLGIDPAAVRALRPDAVTLATLAFGPSGPRAEESGFDMIIQALVGLERRAGGPDGPPLWYRTPYLDYTAGALGAIGVLMALYRQRAGGGPTDSWTSLLNAGLFLVSDLRRDADGARQGAAALDAERLGSHPAERIYRTVDGWIAVAARGEPARRRLWASVLRTEPPGPGSSWGAGQTAQFADVIGRRKTDELLGELAAVDVWAERCRTDGLAELDQSSAAWRERVISDRADARFGRVTGCFGPLVSLSGSPLATGGRTGAPSLGSHTEEILHEVGFTNLEIDTLTRSGVTA
ncbi:MAG: CoA transferase [Frankia sp.]